MFSTYSYQTLGCTSMDACCFRVENLLSEGCRIPLLNSLWVLLVNFVLLAILVHAEVSFSCSQYIAFYRFTELCDCHVGHILQNTDTVSLICTAVQEHTTTLSSLHSSLSIDKYIYTYMYTYI